MVPWFERWCVLEHYRKFPVPLLPENEYGNWHKWKKNVLSHPAVKPTLEPREKLIEYYKRYVDHTEKDKYYEMYYEEYDIEDKKVKYNYHTHWKDVIKFWFFEVTPEQTWNKDPKFDYHIQQIFGECHKKVVKGEYSNWREDPLGALAEIIVLDQFSRHIYRDKPQAFANDAFALKLA